MIISDTKNILFTKNLPEFIEILRKEENSNQYDDTTWKIKWNNNLTVEYFSGLGLKCTSIIRFYYDKE